MRRVARQVKQKQTALLPDSKSLFDNSRPMNSGVVQDHDCQSLQAKRESLYLLAEELAGYCLHSRFNHRPIVSRHQRKAVHSFALLARHEGFFISKLPRIRHTWLK